MNSQQKSEIISFMDGNYKHLYGKHSSLKGPVTKEKKWNQLVEKLNLLGPPCKNVLSWQRCWIDMKSKLKTKVANSKQELKKTGGGPQTIILTEDDLKMINIIKEENVSGLNVNESKVRNVKNITSIEGLIEVPSHRASHREEITYDLTETVELLDVTNDDLLETIELENEMESPQFVDSTLEVIQPSQTYDANQKISNEAKDFIRTSSFLARNPIPSTSKDSTRSDTKLSKVTPKSPKVNMFYYTIQPKKHKIIIISN